MADIVEIINQEMLHYRSKSGYLNNFYMNLPGASEKSVLANYRAFAEEQGNMYESWIESYSNVSKEIEMGNTLLFLNQKRRDFFETIDRALVEEGISIDEVKRLQALRIEDSNNGKELCELVFPAYVRLRRMGYSHRDLIG